MDRKIYDCYVAILNTELIVALGCTEPIAIAYASATARNVLGEMPERIVVSCSGNIVKNVKGVTVPNSGGQKGIETAAILGVLGGDASRRLAVLETATDTDREQTKALCGTDFCTCKLVEGVENLYIAVFAEAGESTALVELKDYHTNITKIVKNGIEQPVSACSVSGKEPLQSDKSLLNLKDIYDFAGELNVDDVRKTLTDQVQYNTALAEEGLRNPYGANIGKTLLSRSETNDIRTIARAYAAAGSDARMSGCSLAAVINSGSGNQGIAVTMPVVKYAEYYGMPEDTMLRALALANLVSIHIKRFIGNLSAYCGAVNAAAGAGAGIAYMLGYSRDVIEKQITNTLATIGGMVCDGAKASCAGKIAAACEVSLLGLEMAIGGNAYAPGEGLVKGSFEETVRSIGRMGREGMKATDIEILNIMLEK